MCTYVEAPTRKLDFSLVLADKKEKEAYFPIVNEGMAFMQQYQFPTYSPIQLNQIPTSRELEFSLELVGNRQERRGH